MDAPRPTPLGGGSHVTAHSPPPNRRADDYDTDEIELVGISATHSLRAHMFEAAFAVATLVGGLLFFLSDHFQDRTVLGRVDIIDNVWYSLYVGGGVLILVGLWFDDRHVFHRLSVGRRVEVLGLFLTGTAAAVEAVTILSRLGVTRASLMTTALSVGCFHRASALLARPRLHVVIPVARRGGLPRGTPAARAARDARDVRATRHDARPPPGGD
jgi:hypothetical protein